MSDASTKVAGRWYRLNSLQVFYLMVQPVLLLAAAWSQWRSNPETARLFWTDALGQQLACTALALLGVNLALLIGGCFLLNFLEGKYWAERSWPRALLQGVLFFACLLFFYLPALFTVVIGPSTVNIQHVLRTP
jgi:hypothetical protein